MDSRTGFGILLVIVGIIGVGLALTGRLQAAWAAVRGVTPSSGTPTAAGSATSATPASTASTSPTSSAPAASSQSGSLGAISTVGNMALDVPSTSPDFAPLALFGLTLNKSAGNDGAALAPYSSPANGSNTSSFSAAMQALKNAVAAVSPAPSTATTSSTSSPSSNGGFL